MRTPKQSSAIADVSTETRIRTAARQLFVQKGFTATTTRDIAAAAGCNVALVNYYYRSKQDLFATVMIEHLRAFMMGMRDMVNDTSTSLEQKITSFVDAYITMLQANPDLLIFILSEIRRDPEALATQVGMKPILFESVLLQQLKRRIGRRRIDPMQYFMTLMAMTVFPFIAQPLLQAASGVTDESFHAMMEQRRALIPLWMTTLLDAKG
ncbi:MAG: TetR/AcrR family transcriptional regulator [Candidatus Kapabacteria bacterium]|nr:TetR/AcrR family transcriptional regulator [Candidatus Kapabacteria bacterium]